MIERVKYTIYALFIILLCIQFFDKADHFLYVQYIILTIVVTLGIIVFFKRKKNSF